MDNGVSVFSDHIFQLGEGQRYDPTTDNLFWFDIVNGLLLEKDVASGALATLYGAALGLAGLDVRAVDADEAVRAGLVEAARENGMIARSGVTA